MEVIQEHTLLEIHSKFNNIEIINQMLNNSNLFSREKRFFGFIGGLLDKVVLG
jgi:hypothetical protein